jgi:hypothetical protein
VSLRARALPKLRAQAVRQLASFTDGGPYMLPGDENLAAAVLADLRACDLYWISEDMTALAMSAGAQLDEARFATADRPCPVGLAVFAGGLGMVDVAPGAGLPVDALLWAPGPGRTLRVWHLIEGRSLFAAFPPEAIRIQPPPLIPIREARLPLTDEPVSLDGLPAHEGMEPARAIVAAMAASWYLMQQPQLVDRTRQEPSRAEARSIARAGLPEDGVTVVDLRRVMAPQDRDPDAGSDGRRYRHRWVVSGHWRDQPYGPSRSLRRQTWIPAYVKGPDGAPLLATERVNVWRR